MNARISVNHAYFHDALSGEFYAPTDPQTRTHTLAHLLLTTFEEGEVTDPNSHNEFRIYKPLWAPIDSALHISHWDIHCLTLASSERQMEFIHTLEGSGGRSLRVIDNATTILEEPLGLEHGSGRLRFLVGQIAQDFFSSVAADQPPK